jgi:flagellar basal-body rod protein FlgB
MILKDHLFNKKLPLLNRALDAYSLRQQTIARNIANATSPVYRPEKVRFEEDFREAQVTQRGAMTNDQHLTIGPPATVRSKVMSKARRYHVRKCSSPVSRMSISIKK